MVGLWRFVHSLGGLALGTMVANANDLVGKLAGYGTEKGQSSYSCIDLARFKKCSEQAGIEDD